MADYERTAPGSSGVVAAGGLVAANNLSDVASPSTSRTNLVLGNVDNTADTAKPVSTAQQAALDLKANLITPALTSPTGLAVPRIAVVAADVTHAQSDTTLADVTGLLVPIGASATEIWLAEVFLAMNAANTTVDYKIGWTVPASCTMLWGATGNAASNVAGWGFSTTGNNPTLLLNAAATLSGGSNFGNFGTGMAALIFGGGTGGNVQLQFAQATSDASNLVVKKGSMLRFTKLVA